MVFVVYNSTTELIDSFKRTQAEADTRAAESADLTAHQGSVTKPRNAVPGEAYFKVSTTTVEVERIPTAPTPTALQRLKATVLTVQRTFYTEVSPLIAQYAIDFPSAEKSQVDDFVLGLKRAFRTRMLDSSLTEAQRTDYASKVLLGPSEVTGHSTSEGTITLFAAVRGITFPAGWVRGQPMECLLWDATDSEYDRRTAQASVDAARTNFPASGWPDYATLDLTDETWIDTIPAYVNPNP